MTDTLLTILIGAGKFIGFVIIFLPLVTGFLGDSAQDNYENKFLKFYFVTWPMIILGGSALALLILIFYVMGKE